MLKEFSDIAPKTAVAALLLWAGANYVLIGPEVAMRVARADHVPACERDVSALIAKAGSERAQSLPLPSFDAQGEFAMEQLEAFRNNPMMEQLRILGGGTDLFGMDGMANSAARQYHQTKQAAKDAYERGLARIKEETATELGKAGSVCGCLADAAIADTRTEWAIFSGSLGLIRPAPLKSFDARMADAHRAGSCSAVKGGA